jgi:hypothetical protein
MGVLNWLDGRSIIMQPSIPWFDPIDSSPDAARFVRMLQSSATAAEKIRGVQSFWNIDGQSSYQQQWGSLALTASYDVAAARMAEPHIDALSILSEAGLHIPKDSLWGVYAAEAPPLHLDALVDASGETVLHGTKPWCSLASELSHAVVTAHEGRKRRTFAVALKDPRVRPSEQAWPSIGLHDVPSGPVTFERMPAIPVGDVGWYFHRPNFAWGGIRVAACWFGGALGLARAATQKHLRRERSALGDSLFGQLDAEIFKLRTVFHYSAMVADSDEQWGSEQAWRLALRMRNLVYESSLRIQQLSLELAGPQLITSDPQFAKAHADLTVYLSQHHGTRDSAALGSSLRSSSDVP